MSLAVPQSTVDWYIQKYPIFGADDIARWKAAGEIVIVDQKGGRNGINHRKN